MISRRGLLKGLAAAAVTGIASGAYAIGIEPQLLSVTRYSLTPRAWAGGPPIRIAVLADFHACEPWMGLSRIRGIVERTNGLAPDLTVLLGDYVAGMTFRTRQVSSPEWASELAGLRAPLGVHAVLGNHDWWDDRTVQANAGGKPIAHSALEDVGIRVHENQAARLETAGRSFWLAGLGDQVAFLPARRRDRTIRLGADDLRATLAQIPDGAPAILLAHEPDIFPAVPARIALTLSGHTHGGQVRLFGYSPVVPSRFRNRYAYGHVREHADLIVSGGLGCSIFPVRLGMPPEIVLVELTPP